MKSLRFAFLLGLLSSGLLPGQVDINTGNLQITPVFNGQAVSGLGVRGSLRVWVDDVQVANHWMENPATIPVLAGNLKITIESEWYEGAVTAYINVAAGATVAGNIELNSVFGLVRGVLTENGGPLPLNTFTVGPRINVWPGPNLPANGLFRMLAPAGSRTAVVCKNGTTLFTFPYTAIAGQEVDLGSPGSMSFLGTIARTGTQASRTSGTSA